MSNVKSPKPTASLNPLVEASTSSKPSSSNPYQGRSMNRVNSSAEPAIRRSKRPTFEKSNEVRERPGAPAPGRLAPGLLAGGPHCWAGCWGGVPHGCGGC